MQLLHDLLRATACRFPEKAAIIHDGRTLTFAQFDRASDQLAAELQRRGIRRGDRVAILMANCPALAIAAFAASKAGAVFVVINPSTKTNKLAYILNDCSVRALVAEPDLAAVVNSARPQVASLETLLWTTAPKDPALGGRTLAEVFAAPDAAPAEAGLIDADLAAIVYTSGSTGFPKGVMLTHRNVTNTAWSISTYLQNTPDDVVICVLPLSFDYGLYQILTGARVGFTVLLEENFAYPYPVLQKISQYRVTGLPGVPTIFATLLQLSLKGEVDLSSVRYLSNTAASLPPAHIRRLRVMFPQAQVYCMYGLTECTRVCYLDPHRLDDKLGSVGKAMPNSEAFVVDEHGRRVAPGVVGELVVRGANVMPGYWGKPAETAERLRNGTLTGERWLYSGDLFYADEEGFLFYVGRKDDVFKCKGEKVSPKEVEAVLCELDAVGEAAVVGIDDPIDGQAIKAFIVPRLGHTLTEQQVRQHCRAHLESYLMPKVIELCDSLPKTDSGKVRKRSLVSPAGDEVGE